jgi:hypothetical protein
VPGLSGQFYILQWPAQVPTECVEGRLIAPLHLLAHVLWDLVQRHMPRALVHHLCGDHARQCAGSIHSIKHPSSCSGVARSTQWGLCLDCAGTHLHVLLPGTSCQLALSEELGKLRLIVGICIGRQPRFVSPFDSGMSLTKLHPASTTEVASGGPTCNAARPQPIANGKGDVIGAADLQDVVPVLVGEVLRVVEQAQLQMPAASGTRSTFACLLAWKPSQTTSPPVQSRQCSSCTFAWMEPPRETMPVMRLAVRWM